MANQTIDLHLRTYRSALRSSKKVDISTLIPTYLKMKPLIHQKAESDQIDRQAFNYALHRMPKEILNTKLIVIGQIKDIFINSGYDLDQWQEVEAPKRRRRIYYHPQKQILACLTTSISDVDDIINLVICLEIELEKTIEKGLKDFNGFKLPSSPPDFKVKLLSGSWVNFTKTARAWWQDINKKASEEFNLAHQNLVFVSSNNHSLINLIDNFCLKNRKLIFKEVKNNFPDVNQAINQSDLDEKCLIYFASQYAFQSNKNLWKKKINHEKKLGILRLQPKTNLELETQIIPGKLIDKKFTNMAILNVEYPLGFGAFHLLEEVLENTQSIKAIYLLGKSAVLNTKIGDILIPKIIFDEHTKNTYMVNNAFNKSFPNQFKSGSILDNQRLVSVLGTFLENEKLFNQYSKKEFNIIEMEAGPYLGAITQATYPKPVPQETIVDLYQPPFELGLVYYSSDNPYILSDKLDKTLGLSGIEATYLSTKAIINQIKNLKIN